MNFGQVAVKVITVLFSLLLLSSCMTSRTTYKIAPERLARIEVDGRKVCDTTPCEINLLCTEGPLAKKRRHAFVVAFPLTSEGHGQPQSLMADKCAPKSFWGNTIEFDDFKPAESPEIFTPEKQLERMKSSFLALSLLAFSYPQEPSYRLTGLGVNYGRLIYVNSDVRIWGSVGSHFMSGKYEKDKEAFDPRAYQIQNLYKIHLRPIEMLFLSVGPMYMYQIHGNTFDNFGIYAGVGMLFSQAIQQYSLKPGFEVGDLHFDVSLELGYLGAPQSFSNVGANFIFYW